MYSENDVHASISYAFVKDGTFDGLTIDLAYAIGKDASFLTFPT